MKSCCGHRKAPLDTGIHLPSKEMGEYEGQRRRSRSDSISEARRSRSTSRGRLDRSLSRGRLDRSSSRGRLDRSSSRGRPDRSLSRGRVEQPPPRRRSSRDHLGPLREERESSQSRLMKSTFSSRSKSRDRTLHDGFQREPRKFSGSQTLPRNLGKERKKSGGYFGYKPANDRGSSNTLPRKDSSGSSNTLPRRDSRGRSPPKSVSKTWISPTPGTSFVPSARPIITPDTLPSYSSRPSSRVSPTESLSFPKTLPFGSTSNFGSAPTVATPSYAPFRSSRSPDRTYRRSPTPDRQIPIQLQGRSVSRDTGLGRSSSSFTGLDTGLGRSSSSFSNNNTQTSLSQSKYSSVSSSSFAEKSSHSSMLRSSSFKENEGYRSSSQVPKTPARKGVTRIGLSSLRTPIIEDPVDEREPLGTNNRLGSDTGMWTGTKHMSSMSQSMSRKSSYSSHVM